MGRIDNPHTVAVLLKRFLGSLQSPVVPVEYFDIVMEYYRTCLPSPPPSFFL